MIANTPGGASLAPDDASNAALSSLEAQFEYALRTLDALCDRRLMLARSEQQELESELMVARASAAAREQEASKLGEQVKQLSRSLAKSEADIKRFEQSLQAVEDGFDEQLGNLEDTLQYRLSELNADAEMAAVRTREAERDAEMAVVRAREAEQQARDLQEQVEIFQREVLALQREISALRDQRDRILGSVTWRMTSPLRKLSTLFRSNGAKVRESSS